SHIDSQHFTILKIGKTYMTVLVTLHFRILRNIGVIRSFCICFLFLLIFIFYRIALYWSKSPWFNHRMSFNRCMAIRTLCVFLLLVTKPIAFCADNNFLLIVLARKVIFCLIGLKAIWSRV